METNNWKWYQYTEEDLRILKESQKDNQNKKINNEWIYHLKLHNENVLEIERNEQDDHYIIKGSLVYDQNFHNAGDYQIFHFYLSRDQFITINLDFNKFHLSNKKLLHNHINNAKTSLNGFLIIIKELLKDYLCRIDEVEGELRELIWDIHEKNDTSILEKIYKRRHELLVWKNLIIPMNELMLAIDEVYLDELDDNKLYTRTQRRLYRALYLIDEYEKELDSIINLEEVVSSHRGNEIMKTLTVMTAIFTPVMAWGALWGMNFKYMPEIEWKYGYLMSVILILVSMIAIYIYLKMKGWTGDLLKSKKKGEFFK